MRELIEAIQQIVGVQLKDIVGMVIANVDAVDEDARTCSCTATSGVAEGKINDVHLMASVDDGVLYVPKIGSTVILMFSKQHTPYVAMFSELSAIYLDVGSSRIMIKDGLIQMNEGEYGGLTKTPELRTQLEKTNSLLTKLLSIISGPPITEPGNGSPSALQVALNAAIAGESLGTYADIEDKTITH